MFNFIKQHEEKNKERIRYNIDKASLIAENAVLRFELITIKQDLQYYKKERLKAGKIINDLCDVAEFNCDNEKMINKILKKSYKFLENMKNEI